MKTFGKFSFALALLAFGLSLSTSPAAAQSTASGTFTLSSETRWGKAVLPAGDYSFVVEESARPIVEVRSADGKTVGLFLTRSLTQIAQSATQSLILTRAGSEMFVSSLQLGLIGLALDYYPPKVTEASLATKLPEHQTSAMLAGPAR